MAYIITDACVGTKDKSCVEACPVDCIHEGIHEENGSQYDMLFIDPEECIHCGLCEPVCPVTAVYADTDVPKDKLYFLQINANFYR